MENSKRPKIIVTDGYKVEHKEFTDPANLENLFIFDDFGERGAIAMGTRHIVEKLRNQDNLVLVVGAGKTHLHHMMPTHFSPLISLHDVLEDRIATPNVFSEVFEQNLDWSKLIVSLQDNNQKN